MRKMFATLFVAISMFFGSLNGVFGDNNYQKGLDAYEIGHFHTAISYFRPLAEQGNVNAQVYLGIMYENGRGVPQDLKLAFEWFAAAALKGHPVAQTELGAFYGQGKVVPGVPKDFKLAYKWYAKAAEQGFAQAQFLLGNLYLTGQGVPKDFKLAFEWFAKSAEQGFGTAQTFLGIMYGQGKGIPQDYIKGYMWINLSITQFKNTTYKTKIKNVANRAINNFEKKMTPEQIAKAKQLASQCYAKKFKDC